MNAWIGKLLRVNLTTGEIRKEPLNMKDAQDFVGGRGLGTKIYCDEVDPKIDPFSPENKIIYMTGPLTGTFAASPGRYEVVTKAPLTGTIGAANSGGHWGPELKFAGYDGVIVEGVAKKPVYIWINDDHVEIRKADHLWGKDVHESTDKLNEETSPDARVACIGPAGENLVLFAGVLNDKNRAAGRGGLGAVMGSKKLKAIVVRGSGSVSVARPEKFMEVSADARAKLKADPIGGTGLPALGTIVLVNIINSQGALPTRNWRDGGEFESANDTGGESLAEKYLIKNKGCFGCSIGCGRLTRVSGGPFATLGEGPEYEAAWAYGASCGVSDLAAITKASHLCNVYGMDPITLGATIACAMEMYEKGILTEKEIGRPLPFGDAEGIVALTEMVGKYEGFGKKLAQGSWRMANEKGVADLSMSTKKQEMPAYDGRAAQGMGLEYATSNRGGCHVRGYMTSPELLGVPVKMDPLVTEGKAGMLKVFQDLTALIDSLGVCLFTTFGLGLAELAAQYREAVGSNESDEEILLKGERVWNIEKQFNIAAGVEKDTLPPRLLREALPSGAAKGKVTELETMLKEYYEGRGWNNEGTPTKEKLGALGLKAKL
ncbi:MAG: aldehyde ferredoxin oxidoreductase family protein [Treponema sp.]|jgi:aldehyde:ferredoxin oxidoreductase|nr:aldehyde ferredoxin oxidoreductase family protein [Treponema sp.]